MRGKLLIRSGVSAVVVRILEELPDGVHVHLSDDGDKLWLSTMTGMTIISLTEELTPNHLVYLREIGLEKTCQLKCVVGHCWKNKYQ